MEAKSFGPTKVTVWSCKNCMYLSNKSSPGLYDTNACMKAEKYLYGIMPTPIDICPYLKNESTNS
jgi:hypothetical protein